jgi:hypothetical protein
MNALAIEAVPAHIAATTWGKEEALALCTLPKIPLIVLENPSYSESFSIKSACLLRDILIPKGGLTRYFYGSSEQIKEQLQKKVAASLSINPDLYAALDHVLEVIDLFAGLNPGKLLRVHFSTQIFSEPNLHLDLKIFKLNAAYNMFGPGTYCFPECPEDEKDAVALAGDGLNKTFSTLHRSLMENPDLQKLGNRYEVLPGVLAVYDSNMLHTAPFLPAGAENISRFSMFCDSQDIKVLNTTLSFLKRARRAFFWS